MNRRPLLLLPLFSAVAVIVQTHTATRIVIVDQFSICLLELGAEPAHASK
jgi:hypothetical protein